MTRRAPWQSLSPKAKEVLTALRGNRKTVIMALKTAKKKGLNREVSLLRR
jgi:hypothetical protein